MIDEYKLVKQLWSLSDKLEEYREQVENDPYEDSYTKGMLLNDIDNLIDAIGILGDSLS